MAGMERAGVGRSASSIGRIMKPYNTHSDICQSLSITLVVYTG